MRIWHRGLSFISTYIFPSSYQIAFYLSAQSTVLFVQASRHQKTNPINERTTLRKNDPVRHHLVTSISWTISLLLQLGLICSVRNVTTDFILLQGFSYPDAHWEKIIKKSPYEQQQCNEDWVVLWAEQLVGKTDNPLTIVHTKTFFSFPLVWHHHTHYKSVAPHSRTR